MKFSKALERKFAKLESHDYTLVRDAIPSMPGIAFCHGRGLYLRPEKDCKRCAWFECRHHPLNCKWPRVKEILASCWTFNPAIPEPGKKGRNSFPKGGYPWDEQKKHCPRYNAMGAGKDKGGEDPCVNCALDRPCKHRGESGTTLANIAQKKCSRKRKERKLKRWADGMFYITRDHDRFVVRIQIDGKQATIGRYNTPEEAKIARDAAMLKLDGKSADNLIDRAECR